MLPNFKKKRIIVGCRCSFKAKIFLLHCFDLEKEGSNTDHIDDLEIISLNAKNINSIIINLTNQDWI